MNFANILDFKTLNSQILPPPKETTCRDVHCTSLRYWVLFIQCCYLLSQTLCSLLHTQGGREVNDFIEFIKKKSTLDVKVEGGKKKKKKSKEDL